MAVGALKVTAPSDLDYTELLVLNPTNPRLNRAMAASLHFNEECHRRQRGEATMAVGALIPVSLQ